MARVLLNDVVILFAPWAKQNVPIIRVLAVLFGSHWSAVLRVHHESQRVYTLVWLNRIGVQLRCRQAIA